jgi:hypothetical protein
LARVENVECLAVSAAAVRRGVAQCEFRNDDFTFGKGLLGVNVATCPVAVTIVPDFAATFGNDTSISLVRIPFS